MKCDQCRSTLEAYYDGELEDEANLKMALHFEDCAACALLLQELKGEGEVYLGYEPPVEIKPELWAMVQSRIVEKRPALSTGGLDRLQTWLRTNLAMPRVSGWATAALILVAIGLTVTFMKYVRFEDEPPVVSFAQLSKHSLPAQKPNVLEKITEGDNSKGEKLKSGLKVHQTSVSNRSKTASRAVKPGHTPDQLVREAEQKYLAAIAMLTRTVERKQTRLDAPTVSRLEQTLASIDRSIADTRKVVQKHPSDPVAVQYMLNAYSRKVDVLREMVGR